MFDLSQQGPGTTTVWEGDTLVATEAGNDVHMEHGFIDRYADRGYVLFDRVVGGRGRVALRFRKSRAPQQFLDRWGGER